MIIHQAVDSVTKALYTWQAGTYDGGAGYPGPNSPTHLVVVAGMGPGLQGRDGAPGSSPTWPIIGTPGIADDIDNSAAVTAAWSTWTGAGGFARIQGQNAIDLNLELTSPDQGPLVLEGDGWRSTSTGFPYGHGGYATIGFVRGAMFRQLGTGILIAQGETAQFPHDWVFRDFALLGAGVSGTVGLDLTITGFAPIQFRVNNVGFLNFDVGLDTGTAQSLQADVNCFGCNTGVKGDNASFTDSTIRMWANTCNTGLHLAGGYQHRVSGIFQGCEKGIVLAGSMNSVFVDKCYFEQVAKPDITIDTQTAPLVNIAITNCRTSGGILLRKNIGNSLVSASFGPGLYAPSWGLTLGPNDDQTLVYGGLGWTLNYGTNTTYVRSRSEPFAWYIDAEHTTFTLSGSSILSAPSTQGITYPLISLGVPPLKEFAWEGTGDTGVDMKFRSTPGDYLGSHGTGDGGFDLTDLTDRNNFLLALQFRFDVIPTGTVCLTSAKDGTNRHWKVTASGDGTNASITLSRVGSTTKTVTTDAVFVQGTHYTIAFTWNNTNLSVVDSSGVLVTGTGAGVGVVTPTVVTLNTDDGADPADIAVRRFMIYPTQPGNETVTEAWGSQICALWEELL